MSTINIWSILVASIVSFIIGAVWYSPAVFGKQWMTLTNTGPISPEQVKGMWKLYVVQFLLFVVTTCILAFGLVATQITSALDGAALGLFVWIGFYATTSIGSMLWERKSWKFILIATGAALINLIVSGAILGGWR